MVKQKLVEGGKGSIFYVLTNFTKPSFFSRALSEVKKITSQVRAKRSRRGGGGRVGVPFGVFAEISYCVDRPEMNSCQKTSVSEYRFNACQSSNVTI